LLSALTRVHAGEAPGLRLRLHLTDVPELADLPWEYIYPGADYDFPALSTRTPVVRYADVPRPVPPQEVTLPLRVLAMVARPRGYLVPDPARERDELNKNLAPLINRRQVKVNWLDEPTREMLLRHLRQEPYHVLHFVGHGRFDPHTQDGFLILTDKQGYADPLDSVRLRRLLQDCPSLRMAVLIACEGARTGMIDPFAGIAATLVRGGIPAVVAMQFEITYGAAAIFESALYQALADKLPLDAAVGEGRKTVDLQRPGTVEWGIPVLYLRTSDGRIFDVAAAPPRLPSPSPELDEQYRRALAYFYDQQMEQATALLEELTSKAPDYPGAYEKLEIARQVAVWENEARLLQQARRWKDVLTVLERIQAKMPEYSDPHKYRAWAEGEHHRDMPNLLYRRGLEALHPQEQEELADVDGAHGLRYLARDLAASGRWETLYRLVAEGDDRLPWAEARCEMERSYAGYLTDLGLAWRHVEEMGLEQARRGEPITAVGAQVRYAVIASSIRLVLSGEVAERDAPLFLLAHALAALGPSLSARPDLLAQALDAARSIDYNGYRSQALAALAPSLAGHPDLLAQALDAAHSIGHESYRSQAIATLAPSLAGHPDLLAQALDAARSIGDEGYCSQAIAALAPSLAGHPDLLAKAIDAARSIDRYERYESCSFQALIALAPSFAGHHHLLAQAVKAAHSIGHESYRSQAIATLAPSLAGHPDLLAKALDAANSIDKGYDRSQALIALAPSLAGHPDLLTQALDATRNISHSTDRSQVLASLALHLPDALRQEALAQALDAARSISDSDERYNALSALAPSLAGHPDLLAKALDAANSIENSDCCSQALIALAPSLAGHPDLLAEALEAARSIGYEAARSIGYESHHFQAIVSLALHLPDALRQEALAQTLDTACSTGDRDERYNALIALAPSLAGHPDLLAKALDAAKSFV
jgi:hypothetical protein